MSSSTVGTQPQDDNGKAKPDNKLSIAALILAGVVAIALLVVVLTKEKRTPDSVFFFTGAFTYERRSDSTWSISERNLYNPHALTWKGNTEGSLRLSLNPSNVNVVVRAFDTRGKLVPILTSTVPSSSLSTVADSSYLRIYLDTSETVPDTFYVNITVLSHPDPV